MATPDTSPKITITEMSLKTKRNKTWFLSLFLFFFVGGYFLFFTSKSWLLTDSDLISATKLHSVISFQDRDISIGRWDYSESQHMMEVEISIYNHSVDGIDKYNFTCLEKSSGYLDVIPVLEDPDLIVLQIKRVPSDFKEISIHFSLSGNESDITKFYTNYHAVNYVNTINTNSDQEYRIIYLDGLIDGYNIQIKELENQKKDLQEKITNIQKNISDLEDRKIYQTTQQQEDTDMQISQSESEIENLEKQSETLQNDIDEYSERIEKAQEQKDDLKK